jgi:SAM-dependent methyltransferase
VQPSTGDALSSFHTYKRHTFELLRLRPGDRVLDVACGTGDDTRALAGFVGWSGRVTGVDRSPALIEEAKKRAGQGPQHCVEFQVGDASRLEFGNNMFDGVRADRALQDVGHAERALTEMVRVSRQGARLVVAEPDWDTLVIDAPEGRLTRAILHFRCDARRGGWGRQLHRRLADAGLSEVSVTGVSLLATDYALADRVFDLSRAAEAAAAAGAVHPDAALEWARGLEAAGRNGRFFCAATAFVASGRKA